MLVLMGFHLPLIFALLSLAVVALASHVAQPVPQLYWNSVLPNTQMTKAISELLQPADSTNVMNVVGKGGVNNVQAGKGKPIDNKSKRVNTVVRKSPDRFTAYRRASQNQLHHEDPNVAVFFLERDMRPGTTMNLHFPRNSNTATFLPRKSARSIPFSSNKLAEIFKILSVKPKSVEASAIKETIEQCETPGIKGEEKYCATSLESMIDFSTAMLGTRDVQAISTEVLEKGATMSMHKYTTMPGVKKLAGDKAVVCHKQNYPYAVFYCHATKTTTAYVASLKGDHRVKAKAVAICHMDTSEWNPKYLAFRMLKVKPGTIPICHFLPNDHIVWVQTRNPHELKSGFQTRNPHEL